MKKVVLTLLLAFGMVPVWGQERDTAYVRMISERAQRNVSGLGITDPRVSERAKEIVMNHYFALNDIEKQRDSLRGLAKDPASGITAEFIAAYVDSKIYRNRFSFLSELMTELTDEQIEGVKNALTYNVMNLTYDSFLDMIPALTEVQKRRIYAWLWEARELAISGGTSNEKHGIFGKYKGKINNYLSKEGYNLTRERDAWNERIEQRRQAAGK